MIIQLSVPIIGHPYAIISTGILIPPPLSFRLSSIFSNHNINIFFLIILTDFSVNKIYHNTLENIDHLNHETSYYKLSPK